MTEQDDLLKLSLGCVGVLVYLPVSIGLSALLVYLGWDWFVVPLGVSSIGYWHALGLAALIGFVTMSTRGDDRDFVESIVVGLTIRLFTLVVMLIAYGMMG